MKEDLDSRFHGMTHEASGLMRSVQKLYAIRYVAA
jgi:hypothetical protein